eukprot:scaffold16071_cov70-Skeletonema_dohrnii-CCMP3373.AAC.1
MKWCDKADLRKHCIAVATIVGELAYPDGTNPKHFSPLQMFETNKYWNLFSHLWRLSELGNKNPEKKRILGMGLKYVEAVFFNALGVNLKDYRKDLEELYEKMNWTAFTKLMFLYAVRSTQEWCVVKDCDFDTTEHKLYGGAGYNDSDHALENIAKVTGSLKKMFCLDVHAAEHKSWSELLAELAKIFRTCCGHHQHDSSSDSCFSELPTECSKEYVLKDNSNAQAVEYPPVA